MANADALRALVDRIEELEDKLELRRQLDEARRSNAEEDDGEDEVADSWLHEENARLRRECADRANLKVEVTQLVEQLSKSREAHAAAAQRLADAMASHSDRVPVLLARVQQLEGERREKKIYAQKRIEEALGKYEGDWLQEACARLKAKREVPLREIARIAGCTEDRARALVEFLGITLDGG